MTRLPPSPDMKTLIIAEKPSVARDLSRALGRFKRNGDAYENDEYVIDAAVGHIVELYMPEDMDEKLRFWRMESLPIIPEQFQLKPIEDSKSKFNNLKKLLKRKDIDRVVNACDAGREGELIFAYLYQASGSKKPVSRLWLQSMTPAAIRKAFEDLRDGKEMRPLEDAARCRSEADWLIGINGTRAITTRMFGRRGKGKQVATVGRVQTPTLALVVDRDRVIREFEPRDYWRIVGTFRLDAGTYEGIYQKPNFRKGDDADDRADRLWQEEAARRVAEDCREAGEGTVTEEKKRTRQSPPPLFDLTTLQREANGRFGLPAGRTLQIAQALYERHKVLTYPRTDSNALPEDYVGPVKSILGKLPEEFENLGRKALDNGWVKPNRRIFNNARVSDHFAIIPTGEKLPKLRDDERKIFDLVVRRFIAVFYPPAEFDVTTRLTDVADHQFKTEGRVLAKPGWLEVHSRQIAARDQLPPITAADGDPAEVGVDEIRVDGEQTKPPARYNEATLLRAMETAGKFVDDDALADAMKERGLGTPATRASTIEHLIREKYLLRENRILLSTPKAENLIEFLKAVDVSDLTSPALTGEWEHKLHQIERGGLSRESFMKEIASVTTQMVERTKNFSEDDAGTRETDITSPTDGKPMVETLRTFRSQDSSITIYKTIGNRRMEEPEVATLIKDRQLGPIDGFRSKAGKPFSAMLRLNDENRVEFVFDVGGNGDGANGSDDSAIDLETLDTLGECPKCKAPVMDAPSGFACRRRLDGSKGCDFRIGRVMLGKTLPSEEIKKLITEGKTGLIEGFRSKRTKRLFNAFLTLKKNGGIGFEFPPRESKGKGRGAKKKSTRKQSASSTASSSD